MTDYNITVGGGDSECLRIDETSVKLRREGDPSPRFQIEVTAQVNDYEDRVGTTTFSDEVIRTTVSHRLQQTVVRHPDVNGYDVHIRSRSDVTKRRVMQAAEVVFPEVLDELDAESFDEVIIVSIQVIEKNSIRNLQGAKETVTDEYGNFRPRIED